MKSPKFGLFRRLIAPKPYVSHQTSHTKGTSLGCQLAPKMIPIAHNCAVWAAALSQTPYPRVPYFGLFGGPGKPLRRNWKMFHRCTYVESDSRLLFQKWSKSVQDKWPKGRVALITKNKTRFGTLGRNPWGDFPHFLVWVRTVARHLRSRFHPDRFRFGEGITEKPVHDAI